MSEKSYFLGIDGGGTGCRSRLIDESGRVIGEGRAGPANLRLGAGAVWAAMEAAAFEATSAAGISPGIVHAAAGIAGTSRREAFDELQGHPHGFASLTIVEDTVIACLGAHGGRDGGIVIAGTGSVGFGIVDGKQIRVGGYGFPMSDEGSGADIGLEAVRRVMKSLDGRIPVTPLLARISGQFGGDAAQAIAWMDRAGATEYAGLAEQVVQHAGGGDVVAIELLVQAAAHIGALAEALHRAGTTRVALVGGLAASLRRHMPDATRALLSPADGDALSGALILAQRAAGLP